MQPQRIEIQSRHRPDLEAVLSEHIYAFNAAITGIHDGTLLNAAIETEAGELVAGITGHTWGGCCEITRLWVAPSQRGRGWGTALMRAAEAEAVLQGCSQIVLDTHSFQAPGFYEKLGFVRVAAYPEYPRGHEKIFYRKQIGASAL